MLRNFIRKATGGIKDRGASAVEYGLMVAAIAAVIVAVVFGLGGLVRSTFQETCTSIANDGGQPAAGGNQAPAGCQNPPAGP